MEFGKAIYNLVSAQPDRVRSLFLRYGIKRSPSVDALLTACSVMPPDGDFMRDLFDMVYEQNDSYAGREPETIEEARAADFAKAGTKRSFTDWIGKAVGTISNISTVANAANNSIFNPDTAAIAAYKAEQEQKEKDKTRNYFLITLLVIILLVVLVIIFRNNKKLS